MMAEEQQDDLSMEDIHSSIKDILDKDSEEQSGKGSETNAVPVAAQTGAPAAAVDVAADAEEDVYDLSASMIIDDPLLDASGDDDVIDLKLDDVDVNISDVAADLAADDINIPEVVAEPVIDPVIPAEEDLSDLNLEIEAEPIFSPEEEASGSANELRLPQDSVDVGALLAVPEENNAAPVVAEAQSVQTEEQDVAENIDDILNSASKVIYADSKAEEKAEPVSAPKTDAADVSANIISNFAKMFAEKAPAESVAEAKEEQKIAAAPIKLLGNGSRTIEQVVEDVIKGIIGESVSAELNSSIDIADYAKEEIKAQTKAWLEAKLPSIVEAAVQKEIERVMAKVGR